MYAAEDFVRVLKDWGIPYFFGLPGSTEAPLLEALYGEPKVRYVLGLHEAVAVAMADGYARASNGPAVVGLHTTVGTMAGMSQIYNAFRDRSPVVVTCGHKATGILNRNGFCVLPDLASMVRPITKQACQTLQANQISEDLNRVLRIASTPPTGPTFLAVPEDLLGAPVAERALPLGGGPLPSPRAGRGEVAAVVDLLTGSQRPVLVAGSDVPASGATTEILDLAEKLALPVLEEDRRSLTGLAFPQQHPQYLGAYRVDHPVIKEADLILFVGATLFMEFLPPSRPALPPQAKVIQIHPDPLEIGRLYPVHAAIAASARPALLDLLEAIPVPPDETKAARLEAIRPFREALERRWASAAGSASGPPLSVARLAFEARRVLPPETAIVEEAVRSAPAFFDSFPSSGAGALFRTGGGGLGWGLPASLGVKLADPRRPVVALVGDGSLQFSVQAFWTAVQQGLAVIALVLNNGSYQAVKAGIESFLGTEGDTREHPGVSLPGIDAGQVAKGYGAHAIRVSHADEVGPALREAMACGRPCLVDAQVASERPKLA